MPTCRILIALSLLLALRAGAQTTLGPFVPTPSLTLYVVGDGIPTTARVTINRYGPNAIEDRIMVRVFDPEEKLIFKENFERYSTSPDLWADIYPVDLPATGVYQIRVTSGLSKLGDPSSKVQSALSKVAVTLSRDLQWGVSFQNGMYSGWPNQPAKLYAWVPRNAESLRLGLVDGATVSVKDQDGTPILTASGKEVKEVTIGLDQNGKPKTERVWTFTISPTISPPENWSFRAADFPLILCPNPEAAQAIRASVEITADGTVLCHKFQRKILEALPTLLDPKNVGDGTQMVKPLIATKSQWLSNAKRNGWLLDTYSGFRRVDRALRSQNVEPTSHWAGAMGTGEPMRDRDLNNVYDPDSMWWEWRLQEKDIPGNPTLPWTFEVRKRWDRLKSIGLYAGTSLRPYGETIALALAATINESFNPYYGDKRLFNRAAAASLSDLLVLGEDEIWRGTDPENADLNPYPGNSAFAIGQKTLEPFSLVAPHMTEFPELRSLWTEGLRRLLDRQYPMYLTTARNQSSHFLTAFLQFYKGTGESKDLQKAREFAARFIQELSPPGYPMESEGPDPSYAGLSHYHMAVYTREAEEISGDKTQTMLDAIRNSYRFFNHTVAPEPDGTMLGACNFGHRIARSFVEEQWGGARGITSDVSEVGLWPISSVAVTDERLNATDMDSKVKINESFATARYLYYQKSNQQSNTSGTLPPTFPAKEPVGSFTRNFGDELIAVKRPSYYAAVFVGKGGLLNFKSIYRLPEDPRESSGGTFSDISDPKNPAYRTERTITPYLGGGLSLFWTPSYGTSLLGTNWAPTTHHGLVATQKTTGNRSWEDASATQFQLTGNLLKITGKIENLPITYTRLYDFRDKEIVVSLQLTATADIALEKLVEVLPFAAGSVKYNPQIQVLNDIAEVRLRIRNNYILPNNSNPSVDVVFDRDIVVSDRSGERLLATQPVTFNVQQKGFRFGDLQINRAEIVLPSTLKPNQTITLNYRLSSTAEAKAPGPPLTAGSVPTLTATPANGAVTLSWTPVAGATGYNIKRELISGQPPEIFKAGIQGTSYVDPNLTNGTTYHYWIFASGPWGIGADSNQASATPAATPKLVSAASRKAHGTVDYDIPIGFSEGADVEWSKTPVECRSGNTLKVVATFNKPVSAGAAKIILGQARLNRNPTFAGNTMTINLNDVSVGQRLQIELTNVTATDRTVLSKAMLLHMRLLTGDVKEDGEVNELDRAAVASSYGTSAGSPGFKPRADITCNGIVNYADVVRVEENYTKKVP